MEVELSTDETVRALRVQTLLWAEVEPMITQTTIEICNNCYDRFWEMDPFTPFWCMKCEYLGLPVSYALSIEHGSGGEGP